MSLLWRMGARESCLRVLHNKKIRIHFLLWLIWVQRVFLSLMDSGGLPVLGYFFFIADGGACKGNDAFVYLNPDLFYPYDLF